MELGLFLKDDKVVKEKAKKIERVLKKHDVKFKKYKKLKKIDTDLLLVLGDDRTVLDVFLELEKSIPVLGVGVGGPHFLTEVEFEDFEIYLKKILKDKYWIEERTRTKVEVNGKELPLALNETVITSSKSGSFLRYSLKIDDQLVWRDSGDGVIVTTPNGSTGYSMSAGGPIIMEDGDVLGITPICSAKENNPIVVSDEAEICFYDISSPGGFEIIIDGGFRKKSKEKKIVVKKSKKPAKFVRFDKKIYLGLFGKLREKSEKIVLPKDAPPSAKFIYKLLDYEGSMTQKEIISESNLPPRTVRHALNYLLESEIIEKHLTLRDTRQSIYMLKK